MNAQPAAEEREGTFALPLTPAMRRFLSTKLARTRTMTLIALGVAAIALPIFFAAGYGVIGVIAVLGVVGYGLYNEVVSRRDAHESLTGGTFGRYVGPLTVDEIPINDDTDDGDAFINNGTIAYRYALKVPDYTFALSQSAGRTLRAAPWGKVDYLDVSGIGAPGGLLLEVRDRQGRSVYRHPQYQPEESV